MQAEHLIHLRDATCWMIPSKFPLATAARAPGGRILLKLREHLAAEYYTNSR
jgi:hypothetical protein